MAMNVRESTAPSPAEVYDNPLISNAKLKQLYRTMLQCRLLEERAQALWGKTPSSLGREASAVSVAVDLLPKDSIYSAPEDLTSSFTKGVPLAALLSRVYANGNGSKTTATLRSYPSRNVVTGSSAEEQLKAAMETALKYKTKKTGNVVAVFCDPSVTAYRYWQEALGVAGKYDLPILFVVHNDLWDETMADASSHAPAYGFPGIPVDGHDAVAVYRVAYESIQRARSGSVPTLIECKSKADNSDPIANMEKYLTRKGLFQEEWKNEIIAEFTPTLDSAIATLGSAKESNLN
jgi:pyruvate dehydrogenase E1 component alpha subunit